MYINYLINNLEIAERTNPIPKPNKLKNKSLLNKSPKASPISKQPGINNNGDIVFNDSLLISTLSLFFSFI